MENIVRFRVDTLKLADEDMPNAEADGTTCYEVDTGIFYIYYKGEWYAQGVTPEPADDDTEPQEESKNNDDER